MSVKLAIRVRPFTEKELKSEKNNAPVVNVVDENTVTITNIKVSLSGAGDSRERLRRYQADYIFDSVCPVTSRNYASQDKVFQAIGHPVLTCISSGVSVCVLAYGQSATGKTYTMMGTDTNPGLIPRLCLAFADLQPLDIIVSFFEIYNERVQDLLACEVLPCNSLPRRTGNSRKDLRVREHPTKGPYVQNLRRVSVQDVESLLSIVTEGKRRRRCAATKRNCNSSRSHALLEISTPRATLRLVDLAGSERAGREGYGGCRQKEGANINKSLVALSNVIAALVSDGARGRFVPYRNSALTWLLKDCFTGGANTFIVATISPSTSCYSETASTLRWVARARHLPPKLPHTKDNIATKAALQARYNQILLELTKHYIQYIPETGKILFDDKHWNLNINSSSTTANIGNIMNLSREKINDNSDPAVSSESECSKLSKLDKQKITKERNKEIDTFFAPLERARSGSDFEVAPPMRYKRKFRSQEVLSTDKSQPQFNQNTISEASQCLSEEALDKTKNINAKNSPISIMYDNNQRADIVASVTDRLYSKLKRNEETVLKTEAALDKNIVQPLNELKICTNARQRLMEISQKAIKHRRKIGIPAYTQTKKNIVRMKDQGIDTQTDLLSYRNCEPNSTNILCQRDAGTETISFTPRYKEVAIGSDYGTLSLKNSSTMTDKNKIFKQSSTMTNLITQNECYTQTLKVLPPTKKIRRSKLFKYLKKIENKTNSISTPSVININFSSSYNQDSELQHSEEDTDDLPPENRSRRRNVDCKILSPDLLKNHNNLDSKQKMNKSVRKHQESSDEESSSCDIQIESTEAIITDDYDNEDNFILPCASVDTLSYSEMNNIILDSSNLHPYDKSILPTKEKNAIRTIRFSDLEDKLSPDLEFNYDLRNVDTDETASTNSYRKEKNRSWKTNNLLRETPNSSKIESHSGHYIRNKNRFKSAQAKLHEEILGLREEIGSLDSCSIDMDSSLMNNDLNYTDSGKCNKDYFGKYYNQSDTFDKDERNIKNSCKRLESAVNNYEKYLNNHKARDTRTYSPTEYLRHLIEIRKELVKLDQ